MERAENSIRESREETEATIITKCYQKDYGRAWNAAPKTSSNTDFRSFALLGKKDCPSIDGYAQAANSRVFTNTAILP